MQLSNQNYICIGNVIQNLYEYISHEDPNPGAYIGLCIFYILCQNNSSSNVYSDTYFTPDIDSIRQSIGINLCNILQQNDYHNLVFIECMKYCAMKKNNQKPLLLTNT